MCDVCSENDIGTLSPGVELLLRAWEQGFVAPKASTSFRGKVPMRTAETFLWESGFEKLNSWAQYFVSDLIKLVQHCVHSFNTVNLA